MRAIDSAQTDINKPKCFVTISGVGYYRPSVSEEYDEQSISNVGGDKRSASDYLIKLAQDWEDSSKLSDESHSTRRVVIRSGVVLGKGGGIIEGLQLPFSLFLGGPIGELCSVLLTT